jgi:NAD(P)-dependent dehydrogenase (short-subunit alcohol dehydrogenase family)
MSRLEGKVAVVTGGEGGIGVAVVDLFIKNGARVVSLDVLEQPHENSPILSDPESTYLRVDVGSEASVSQTIEKVLTIYPRVDILVNGAGIAGEGKLSHEISEEEFDLLFRVNVKGTWLMTKHLVPHFMKAGGGSVINLSSIAGLVGGVSAQSIYHSTKGAVRLLTKADAVAYAPHGIRVNSVHPGSIDTPLSQKVADKNPGGPEAHFAKIIAKHPIGRRGRPEEIAYAVMFLASDESSFITGIEMPVDGGYTAQ